MDSAVGFLNDLFSFDFLFCTLALWICCINRIFENMDVLSFVLFLFVICILAFLGFWYRCLNLTFLNFLFVFDLHLCLVSVEILQL